MYQTQIYNKILNYNKNNNIIYNNTKLNDTNDRINTEENNVKNTNKDKSYNNIEDDIHIKNWNEFNSMINIEHKVTNIENHFKVLNKL
jgi:hypothetical protein